LEMEHVDLGQRRGRHVQFLDQLQQQIHRLGVGGDEQAVGAQVGNEEDVFEEPRFDRRSRLLLAEETQGRCLGDDRAARGGPGRRPGAGPPAAGRRAGAKPAANGSAGSAAGATKRTRETASRTKATGRTRETTTRTKTATSAEAAGASRSARAGR